jgi:thiosulfate dehydrogenase [quinone] large subunit
VTWKTRPYYYGSDIVFAFAWTAFVLGGAPVWSVDSWRARRRQQARADGAATGGLWRAERRRVLAGAGALVAVAGVTGVTTALIGRGLGRNKLLARPTTPGSSPAAAASTPPGNGVATGGTVIASLAQLPVGGTREFTNPATGRAAVLLRPADRTVLAYDRTCPHLGCLVTTPPTAAGPISCACHGSAFDAATGAVTAGPAPKPLTRIAVGIDASDNVVAT